VQHDAIAGLHATRNKASRDTLGFVSKPPIGPQVFLKDESCAVGLGFCALHQRVGKDRHWKLL
jgi:hypothetical protein